ncbi:MAG: hypothetical protein BWZ02_02975 [Lentisphaerae bacterium ADurb.BinA184]|nr:MAG: hypothetical protein BWZ02_02975 [Lentisphaerae bacterium ADurb.BinA184]
MTRQSSQWATSGPGFGAHCSTVRPFAVTRVPISLVTWAAKNSCAVGESPYRARLPGSPTAVRQRAWRKVFQWLLSISNVRSPREGADRYQCQPRRSPGRRLYSLSGRRTAVIPSPREGVSTAACGELRQTSQTWSGR